MGAAQVSMGGGTWSGVDWDGYLRDYIRNRDNLYNTFCTTCGEDMMMCAWDGSHDFTGDPRPVEEGAA